MNEQLQRALDPSQALLALLISWLPRVLFATLVLCLGLLLALLARRITRSAAQQVGLDALAERYGVARLLYALQIRGGLSALLGNLMLLVVLLLTLATSAEIVGLPGVAEGVAAVVEFLPRVVSAGVVALFGFAAADLASRVVEGVGQRRQDLISPKFAANLVYYLTLSVFSITAAQHLGINTELLDLLIVTLTGAAVGGVALSFAWASKELLRDVLCRPYVLHQIQPGARIQVGEARGEVVSTGVITLTLALADQRQLVLPYRRLLESPGFQIYPEPESS